MTINRSSNNPCLARQQLARVVAVLECSGDGDLAQWFGAGASAWLHGDSESLCRALGLRATGLDLPSTIQRREVTREHLHLCLAEIPNDPTTKLESRLRDLLSAVSLFEQTTWTWSSALALPPETLEPLERAIWTAFRSGARFPGTPKQLRRILLKRDMK